MAGWILNVIGIPVVPFYRERRVPRAWPRAAVGSIEESQRDAVKPTRHCPKHTVQAEDDELDPIIRGPLIAEPLDGGGGVEPDVAGGLVVAMASIELPARFLGWVAMPRAAHTPTREHGELTDVVGLSFTGVLALASGWFRNARTKPPPDIGNLTRWIRISALS